MLFVKTIFLIGLLNDILHIAFRTRILNSVIKSVRILISCTFLGFMLKYLIEYKYWWLLYILWHLIFLIRIAQNSECISILTNLDQCVTYVRKEYLKLSRMPLLVVRMVGNIEQRYSQVTYIILTNDTKIVLNFTRDFSDMTKCTYIFSCWFPSFISIPRWIISKILWIIKINI